ncbi:MAG: class I SAM-dependent methyltransferase [Cyanobacteria bacterium RM1_2_2]|nr:class I SAM-dependent methyltransferase [Cyanobacteria bacterium RM1_2_2]
MHQEIREILSELDRQVPLLNTKQLQKKFENVPLEVFGGIQVDRPPEFSNLMNWLPKMPSADVQISWTGNADHALLKQSISFIRLSVGKYHELVCKPMSESNVLDFGCGWGRLIRLLYKYVPIENIYGVDPWDRSLAICHSCNLHGNLYLSDYIPRTLPTPTNLKFDFIQAFSVFTHLSEKVTKIAIETLKNHLSDEGILVLTIRPKEYWTFVLNQSPNFSSDKINQLLDEHDRNGFAFCPHDREKIEGEVTYGDTSISLEYIKSNFNGLEIAGVEWSETDVLQMIVFLRKRRF